MSITSPFLTPSGGAGQKPSAALPARRPASAANDLASASRPTPNAQAAAPTPAFTNSLRVFMLIATSSQKTSRFYYSQGTLNPISPNPSSTPTPPSTSTAPPKSLPCPYKPPCAPSCTTPPTPLPSPPDYEISPK